MEVRLNQTPRSIAKGWALRGWRNAVHQRIAHPGDLRSNGLPMFQSLSDPKAVTGPRFLSLASGRVRGSVRSQGRCEISAWNSPQRNLVCEYLCRATGRVGFFIYPLANAWDYSESENQSISIFRATKVISLRMDSLRKTAPLKVPAHVALSVAWQSPAPRGWFAEPTHAVPGCCGNTHHWGWSCICECTSRTPMCHSMPSSKVYRYPQNVCSVTPAVVEISRSISTLSLRWSEE